MAGGLLVWAALVALALWGAGRLFPSAGRCRPDVRRGGVDGRPLEILARRYARGELSREEYEVMKKDLSG